jgi:hypothetical protein
VTLQVTGLLAAGLLAAGPSAADDDVQQPDGQQPADLQQHNVTYRAKIRGLARGAVITYRISDVQVNSASPTMLPGRTFEATGVLTDAAEAGMRISIQWPYTANLSCEILVDEQTVVQASQIINPKLTPADNDPDYGALVCGAPLTNAVGAPATPALTGEPAPGESPAEPASSDPDNPASPEQAPSGATPVPAPVPDASTAVN